VLTECPDFDTQGEALYNGVFGYDWAAADLDNTGLADSWEAALFNAVLCDTSDRLNRQAVCTFLANRAAFLNEPAAATYGGQADVIAAFLTASTTLQAAIRAELGLTGNYTVVAAAGKASLELFAPNGDMDSDIWVNGAEYDNILAAARPRADYVYVARNPLLHGSEDPDAEVPLASGLGLAALAGLVALAARRVSKR